MRNAAEYSSHILLLIRCKLLDMPALFFDGAWGHH
jgi:hypothetical protein